VKKSGVRSVELAAPRQTYLTFGIRTTSPIVPFVLAACPGRKWAAAMQGSSYLPTGCPATSDWPMMKATASFLSVQKPARFIGTTGPAAPSIAAAIVAPMVSTALRSGSASKCA
jgi:hypothetical protein